MTVTEHADSYPSWELIWWRRHPGSRLGQTGTSMIPIPVAFYVKVSAEYSRNTEKWVRGGFRRGDEICIEGYFLFPLLTSLLRLALSIKALHHLISLQSAFLFLFLTCCPTDTLHVAT